jgi:hypothetical protein
MLLHVSPRPHAMLDHLMQSVSGHPSYDKFVQATASCAKWPGMQLVIDVLGGSDDLELAKSNTTTSPTYGNRKRKRAVIEQRDACLSSVSNDRPALLLVGFAGLTLSAAMKIAGLTRTVQRPTTCTLSLTVPVRPRQVCTRLFPNAPISLLIHFHSPHCDL